MTQLTTKQLAAKLQPAATAAEIQQIISAITARRRIVKERLTSIEDRNGKARREVMQSADSEALARLNAECEQCDDELGFLSHLEARAFPLHAAAVERETLEAGQRAHKRIGPLTTAATDALAKYETARQQLRDAVDAIGSANQSQRDVGDRVYLDAATLARVLDAMWPCSLVRDEQRAGALSGISRWCAPPPPPNYGEPAPDFAEQMHRNMFARRDS